MSRVAGIVLAGGSGTRMGLGRNKALLRLCGQTVLGRSIAALSPFVDQLIVVRRPEDAQDVAAVLEEVRAALPAALSVRVVDGGDTRQASVRHGLQALEPDCGAVLIHDAARCLVDAATIRRVLESVEAHGSGIAAVPTVDTIKRVTDGLLVEETLQRDALWAVQTPQGFRRDWIEQAHAQAEREGFLGTDDASLAERAGFPVRLVMGDRHNLKLTTPEDIAMAEVYLRGEGQPAVPALRIGQGYDVHRFCEGRPLMLCGVEVPHTHGLDGHSDADVAVHALMDAMLGALALGDIGQHFPDTDPCYKGISSMELLRHVKELAAQHGATLVNADVTIVAQAPKLAPHIPAMRASLAEALDVPVDRVSVKATTTERLGFEGRREGISAQAVVMMQITA